MTSSEKDIQEGSDFLASNLANLISALGEKGLNSQWLCKYVECYGENTDELHVISDGQVLVGGRELLRIVQNVENIVDGYFSAFLDNETKPWLVVRAIDNSVYRDELSRLVPPGFKSSQTEAAPPPHTMAVQGIGGLKRFSLAINDNGAAISELLKQMQAKGTDAENFIILIANEKKNYYIQVTPHSGDPAWLYMEAAGNENLDPEYELGPAQIEQMRSLYWEKDPHSPNFTRVMPARSDGERTFIARIIKQTFVKVYGMKPKQEIVAEMSSPNTPMTQESMKRSWDPVAYAETMKKSTSPVSAFFLIDSLDAIPRCKQWLALLKPYNMLDMEHSKYFDDVREIYESGREIINFDHDFRLHWQDKDLQGLLRCHFVDKGRYEIELWLPGVIANEIADKFNDGHNGFFCAFMPPMFYD